MIYKQKIETPSYLCDEYDRLHPWAAVRLCQEVTEYHGNATGIGFKTLVSQNRAWVLTRALYIIKRLPEAFEPIELSTWSRGHNGLIAWRDYRMLNASGEELLTGTSYWPMIDMTTRHVLRLNDVIAGYENHNIQATEYSEIPKIKLPDMSEPDVSMDKPVTYSMLDHTRHVNNSEYIRLIFDSLHELGFDSTKQFLLVLNYNQESKLGDILHLSHKLSPEGHFLRIDNNTSLSVSALVKSL